MRASEFLKMGRIFGNTGVRAGDPDVQTAVRESKKVARGTAEKSSRRRSPLAPPRRISRSSRGRMEVTGTLRLLPDGAVGVYDAREDHLLD
jgi:predicted sugar kinase